MAHKIETITEIESNRLYKLESKYDIFFVQIPKEFLEMTPNQLWLLEHQITAFGHGFNLDNSHIIPIESAKTYRYPRERKDKWLRIDPQIQENNIKEYLGWLCGYKKNWTNGIEYDAHPQNFDEFLNREKNSHWENRLLIFLMIVLLQDVNSSNVQCVPKEMKVSQK